MAVDRTAAWALTRRPVNAGCNPPGAAPLRPHQPAAEDHIMRILHFLTPQRAVDLSLWIARLFASFLRRFVRPAAVVLPKGKLVIGRRGSEHRITHGVELKRKPLG